MEKKRPDSSKITKKKMRSTLKNITDKLITLENFWGENQRQHSEFNTELNEIIRKIGGTGIGNVGEIITIRDLKQVSPMDSFDETRA